MPTPPTPPLPTQQALWEREKIEAAHAMAKIHAMPSIAGVVLHVRTFWDCQSIGPPSLVITIKTGIPGLGSVDLWAHGQTNIAKLRQLIHVGDALVWAGESADYAHVPLQHDTGPRGLAVVPGP